MDLEFGIREDVVVVSRNPEAMDIDNPHGFVYGKAYNIVSEDDQGARHILLLNDSILDHSKAAKLCNRIRKHVSEGGLLTRNLWAEIAPRYGSPAFMAMGEHEAMNMVI